MLQSVFLRPGVSMIEVMRRFRASPETRILRASHTNGASSIDDFWRVQFMGPMPQLADLLPEVAP